MDDNLFYVFLKHYSYSQLKLVNINHFKFSAKNSSSTPMVEGLEFLPLFFNDCIGGQAFGNQGALLVADLNITDGRLRSFVNNFCFGN